MTTSIVRPARALATLRALVLAALAPVALAAQVPSAEQALVAGGPARPISLDEAMRLADRNSPQTVQTRGTIRTNRATVRSTYGSFLPDLTVGTSSTRQGGDRIGPQGTVIPFTGQAWSYGSGMNANLELFDGGRRFFDLRQARQNVEAAEASDIATRFNVRLNVAQQYYNVLAARESEAAAQAQLQQAEQQLRVSSARVAAGAATRSDSLRAIIQVGNARLALVTAENALNTANAALTRLVGAQAQVTANPADTLAPTAPVPDSATLARLAARGPAVEQAEAQHRAARAGERAAWTSYLPTVNLSYNRSGGGFDRWFGLGPSSYSCTIQQNGTPTATQCPNYVYSDRLNLSLSFPLFDGFTREATRVRADVQEDVAQAQLRDAQLLAQQTLVANLGTLRTARERIDIQQASVAAAEEDLRVQQQRYALGASTQLDVLTSQTQLDQARAQLIQARYDYRVARASIEALIGRPLP